MLLTFPVHNALSQLVSNQATVTLQATTAALEELQVRTSA